MKHSAIPTRRSSRRARSPSKRLQSSSPSKGLQSDGPSKRHQSRSPVKNAIKSLFKKLEILDWNIKASVRERNKNPADIKNWELRRGISRLELERLYVERDMLTKFPLDLLPDRVCEKTPDGIEREIALKTHEESTISEHISLLKRAPERLDEQFRDMFYEAFWGSRSNLNRDLAAKRDSTLQSNFRKAIIEESDAVTTDDKLWCPIEGEYILASAVKAAHIFPQSQGKTMMKGIFGRGDELFSTRNGMLMGSRVEKFFDKGKIYLIPDADLADSQDVARWIKSEGRPWIVRTRNLGTDARRAYSDGTSKTLAELDGKKVIFRTSLQPRARYLYWHYLKCIMQDAMDPNGLMIESLQERKGRVAWVTAGRWMGKGMLYNFTHHCGQEFLGQFAGVTGADIGIETGGPTELLEWSAVAANSGPFFEDDSEAEEDDICDD